MTRLHVGIAPYEEIKRLTLAVARGETVRTPDTPQLWFTSPEGLAKALSEENQALLRSIATRPPASLQELAERTGRQPSNLSRTLRTLERYGLVELRRGRGRRLLPVVPYDEIRVTVRILPEGVEDEAA